MKPGRDGDGDGRVGGFVEFKLLDHDESNSVTFWQDFGRWWLCPDLEFGYLESLIKTFRDKLGICGSAASVRRCDYAGQVSR